MSRFTKFYTKLLENTEATKQLADILGQKSIEQATDEELAKVGALAESFGIEISVEEAKQFFRKPDAELADEELDSVAGGKGKTLKFNYIYCEIGGSPDANRYDIDKKE